MAEEMEKENWIKTAVPNRDTKSIYVTVQEGYIYQVYYDEQTGELVVYPIGPDDGHSIPKLKVSYDKINAIIHAEASCEDEIVRIELRYKGEVVGTKENSKVADFNVQKTGWYEVRAVCAKGKEVYGRIRISSTIIKPNIEVTSDNEKENDWYGKDNKEVEVTISTENETAVGIWYKTNKDEEYTYQEGRSKVLTIKEVGRTVIYAYVVDKNGNESEIANKTIQYDNIRPVIDLTKIEIKEGTQEEGSDWYKTNVVLSLEKAITDQPQEVGIDGYYVWEITNEETPGEPTESNYQKGIDKQVRIETDGIHALAFIAKDRAGNKSGITTLTIKKDSTSPKDFTLTVKDITVEGFTIATGTSDETSGIAKYNFYVGGELKSSIESPGDNKAVESVITGLAPKTSYLVYVQAVDRAGNIKETTNITVTTLMPPAKPGLPNLLDDHDTGISNVDNITRYWQGVEVNGNAEPNALIHVYISDTRVAETYADANGYWHANIDLVQNAVNYISCFAHLDLRGWSERSDVLEVTCDTTPPTVPTVTYNSGANTCSWKNNYNITFSSTDNVGIWKYEDDFHGNGTVDTEVAANFIPPNGYNSCTNIFRAIDIAGNASGWTAQQHIHQDTGAPTITKVWYGAVANGGVSLYIQVADDFSRNKHS